jgi:hypothetical protein
MTASAFSPARKLTAYAADVNVRRGIRRATHGAGEANCHCAIPGVVLCVADGIVRIVVRAGDDSGGRPRREINLLIGVAAGEDKRCDRSVVAGLISAQAEAGYLSGLLDKNLNDVLAGDRRLAEANGALRAYIGAQHGALCDRLMEVVSGEYAAYFAAGEIRSNPSLAGGGPQYVPIPVPDMPFVDPAPAIPTPSMPRPCFGFVDPGASYAGAICY